MTSGGGTVSAEGTPARRRRFINMPERDPKKLGIFGAPQCRCTPLVLALCVALTGLVTVGAGACMAAFMWHDTTPRALGLALVGLGISMIAAGAGLFIYDSCVRSLMPGPPRDNAGAAYTVQQQGQLQTAPIPLSAAAVTNVQAMPSGGGQSRRVQGTAPPPYDAVLQEDIRYRTSHGAVVQQQQVSTVSQARDGSYHSSVVRQTRVTDSTV